MDEISNSGSFQPSSPVMESPLMQLANASVSVLRASLSPKEIKNSGVEPKSSPLPASYSISHGVDTDPHISLLSNTNIDSFARTHVPLEGNVSCICNPSPDKLIRKSSNTSLIFVGTENPVQENISIPEISEHGNFSPQITGANVEVTTQESDSFKEHSIYSLPLDGSEVNVTKSSVSRILTSNLNESIFTTSNMISAVAAGDAISKKTNIPKDYVSQTSQPMLPRLIPLPSQINARNPQTENVPVKTSILKFTTSENEKSIPLQPSESIPKASYTALQNLQYCPLTQKDTKAFANPSPVSVCTVTQSHKDTNNSRQIKHLSNAELAPVSNIICSLPSKNPFVLPVSASSTPTAIVLQSRPLLQMHTISQTSTTHSLLNEHSQFKISQNISENVTITSEIISSSTSANVPTTCTSSVKLIPSFSPIPFPAKSCDNISPCTVAIGDVSCEKKNMLSNNISSVNFISKIDKKDIASCPSSVRAVQAKAGVEIPSKLSFPVTSTKVAYCSSEGINTLAASKSSLAKNADTNFIPVCTVDSLVAFCTPSVITTTSAIVSIAKSNANGMTHTLSINTTHGTTYTSSASVASCSHSVSAFAPIITTAPCFTSLTTSNLPTTHTTVPCRNMPLITSSGLPTFMHTSDNATSTLIATSLSTITTSTLAVTTCIPVTAVQSPKKLETLQEYEIMSNISHVNDTKNEKPSFTSFINENPFINVTNSHTSNDIGEQARDDENADKQKHHLITPAFKPFLTDPRSDRKPQNNSVRTEVPSSIAQTEAPFSTAGIESPCSLALSGVPSSIAGAGVPPFIAGTEAPPSIARTEAPPSIARTEAPPSIARTEEPPSIAGTEAPASIAGTEAPASIAGTEAPASIAGTEAPASIAGTEAPASIAGTEAPASIAGTEAPASIAGTEAPASIAGTEAPASIAGTEAPASIAGTEAPASIAGTEAPASIAGTEAPASIAGTEAPASIAGTDIPPSIAGTDTPPSIAGTDTPPSIAGTDTPPSIAGTDTPPSIAGTDTPPSIAGTDTPPSIAGTDTPPSIAGTETPPSIAKTVAAPSIAETVAASSIAETEPPSSSHNQLSSVPDESFVIVIKPSSDKKASGCKSIDQLSENFLSRIEANMDSSDKQSFSARITETHAISNTVSDCMTTISHLPDRCLPFSDQKSASVSLIGTVVSVVGDDTKINLLTNKNDSYLSSPVVSDKSELVPSPKKLLKKSKPPEKESKSHTVSNMCTSSDSVLPSAISKDEPVTSDFLNLSPSYPTFANLLKDNLTISSNEKNESLMSTVNTEAAVSTKGSVPTKIGGCSISTRPRRTIKARHLFSSSSYSTGSTKSDAAGENSSSSNKQRKRIAQSTDEEKKCTGGNAIKKPHTNRTATDEETCSRLKKPVRRRILPAVKSDSADASKNCLLIKASPNVAQVSSDTSLPPGYTYLLTALSLTTAEKDSVKIVKTPTMASNSGVTSTSPTYCNSKRNVTTKCSTIKEQKSSDLAFVDTDKTCTDSSISSSRKSTSQKTWNVSPVNYAGNTSDDSLENATESGTLQNSVEISLSRKMKNSTSDVNASSNSPNPKSGEDLSLQIAEAEKFIKKEPIEVTEVDQTVIENNIVVTSQNSSEVCAPTRVTREIRKLLNAGCNNTQVSLVQDLISPSPGNNLSQTRPLAPVQLSSPYAIFLPVSLASGATTTVTTPPASTPLYSIQLNVPNVVRMGKPFLPNDGSMSKKHCTIIPAITCPKIDNSSMKSNLISRNNLIATYYPAPLPESLMNKISVNYHACGECGDTFLFKSSLNTHKTRKCMQLTYNCDNCTMKLVFYNKCSVLEHIRSHYPTRPVTIKLDRMEVMTLPEGISSLLEMEDESDSSYRDPEDATKFDCTECGAKFHSARALADHFGHSEIVCSFTFYCALCQTYLPRHCAQLAHRRVHHEKPPHVCPECGLLISNLFSFREHLKYKCMHFSRIAPLICPKCMSKFCYTPELKEHIINVHSETFIKCSICPMAFKASASYQTHHQNTHASELEQKKEIYKCPLCDTVFHSIQQLMNHVDVHIGELKKDISYAFRCSICFSIFAKRSQLVSHLGSSHHLDYVQHRCEFCDCVCKTAHNLQTHQRAIHKVELKRFEFSKNSKMKGESAAAKSKKMKIGDVTHCSLCHIFFATLAQLQMHTMKVHQKKMNDSLQDSGTSLSSALVPINKNSQKFCRYCKAPYKSWSRLMQHILGHRNSGVYICLICTSAAFISKEELSKHEEFCSGENLHDKPPAVHECEECHQLFKQESWLIAHQKNIHPKKGAFTCDLCGLPYKSNSSLQKHIQTVHEGKRSFFCYVCKELNKEKFFRCQSQLEKHLMTKHKMSLNQMKMKQSDVEEKLDRNSSHSEEPIDKNKQAAPKNLDVVPAKKAKFVTTKEETYICAKCNFTSQNSEIFQLHIQEHKTSEDGIQCSTCGLCFAAVDSLRMHLFAMHKIKRSNDSLRDQGVDKSPVSKVLEDSNPSTGVQSSTTNTLLTIEASESTTTIAAESVSKTAKMVKLTSDTNSDCNSLSCQCNVCYKMFETEHLLKVHMRTHGMAFIRSKRLTMSE